MNVQRTIPFFNLDGEPQGEETVVLTPLTFWHELLAQHYMAIAAQGLSLSEMPQPVAAYLSQTVLALTRDALQVYHAKGEPALKAMVKYAQLAAASKNPPNAAAQARLQRKAMKAFGLTMADMEAFTANFSATVQANVMLDFDKQVHLAKGGLMN